MILLLATLAVTVPAPAGGEETRSPGLVNVRLYIHLSLTDASMDTSQGRAGTRTTNSVDIPSADLEENLLVRTVDTGVGSNRGFEVHLSVLPPSAATVTMSILAGDTVIAERQREVSGITVTDWRIPLLDDADHYTFSRGDAITLRMEASRSVIVRSNEQTFMDLYCEDHLAIETGTRDVDDRKASRFFPNDLMENRHIIIEGDVTNPFGSADIGGVNITIRRPDGQYAIQDQAATVGADMNYTYDWAYNTGLPSGSYTLNVTGRDLQGHEFSVVGSFIMSQYGVRIFAEGEEGGVVTDSTTPGTPAKYTLTILNIGGNRADIVLDDGDPQSLWTTSFSRKTFSLDAGGDEDVTYDVKPSSILRGGNESKFTVTVTVNNDPSVPKASDTLEVRTFVTDEVDLQMLPESPAPVKIAVGGTKDYTFTVRNIGELSTNVDLTRMGVPTGWQATFRGSRVQDDAIENLQSMEIVDVTLRVIAPTASDVKKASIKVKAQSREFPDTFQERTFEFNLVIGLVLTPTSPTTTTQDPGDTFTLFFEARNDDDGSSHQATFSVVQDTTSWPSSSFSFTPSNMVSINPDSTVNMGLEVSIPDSAQASGFPFTVRGIVDGKSEVHASFDFLVTINLNRELVIELNPAVSQVEIDTKEESIVYLVLENRGNQVEYVNITIEVDADDVEVRTNDAFTSIILRMPVQPGDTEEVKISFKAKESAAPNQEIAVTVSASTAADPTPIDNDFRLVVKLSNAELAWKYLQWAIVLMAMLGVMGAFLLWNPRRRKATGEPEGKKEKDAPVGAVVRQ